MIKIGKCFFCLLIFPNENTKNKKNGARGEGRNLGVRGLVILPFALRWSFEFYGWSVYWEQVEKMEKLKGSEKENVVNVGKCWSGREGSLNYFIFKLGYCLVGTIDGFCGLFVMGFLARGFPTELFLLHWVYHWPKIKMLLKKGTNDQTEWPEWPKFES